MGGYGRKSAPRLFLLSVGAVKERWVSALGLDTKPLAAALLSTQACPLQDRPPPPFCSVSLGAHSPRLPLLPTFCRCVGVLSVCRWHRAYVSMCVPFRWGFPGTHPHFLGLGKPTGAWARPLGVVPTSHSPPGAIFTPGRSDAAEILALSPVRRTLEDRACQLGAPAARVKV